MKDEEMAEEYLKKKLEERKDKFIFELPEVYITDVKQAFLAGYKAGFETCAQSRLNVTTISDCPNKDEEESKYKTAYIKGIRTMANALKDYDKTDGAWTDYFEHTVDKVLKRLLKEIE